MSVIHFNRRLQPYCGTVAVRPELAPLDETTCLRCLKVVERDEAREAELEAEAWMLNRQHAAAHAAGFGDAFDWLMAEGNPSSHMTAQILASVGRLLVEQGFATLEPKQAAA